MSEPDKSAIDKMTASEIRCLSKRKRAYFLQEVNIFNNRVIWYLEQQQKQEIFALVASGALWAYVLQSGNEDFVNLLIFLPALITVALAIKSQILTKAMGESMDYLAKLESIFDLGPNLGWVHFYRQNTSHYKRRWRLVFWLILIVLNFTFSIVYYNSNEHAAVENNRSIMNSEGNNLECEAPAC